MCSSYFHLFPGKEDLTRCDHRHTGNDGIFSEGLGYCNRYSPGLATAEEMGISEKIAGGVGATGGRPVSAGVLPQACLGGDIKGRHTGLPLQYPLHRVGCARPS